MDRSILDIIHRRILDIQQELIDLEELIIKAKRESPKQPEDRIGE